MIPLIGGFVLLGLGLIGYFLYQSQYAHPSDNPSEQIEVNQDSLLLVIITLSNKMKSRTV
jgi:hypothetical protein